MSLAAPPGVRIILRDYKTPSTIAKWRKETAMRSRRTLEPSLVPVRLVVADLFRSPENRGELAAQPSCFLERLSVLARERNGRADLACWNQEAGPTLC